MSLWNTQLSADVRPATVEWLWPGYFPRGKLAILDGDPEVGKSLLSIDIAARLSRGGELPDGRLPDRPITSLLLGVEDGIADTVRPRLEAAGADLSRVILAGALNGRVPRFPDDVSILEDLIVARSVELVVIDPVMAFLPPKIAANLDQCVRQALMPLADLADRAGCMILLIRHLTKGWQAQVLHRGLGSVGIVAAARIGMLAAYHPEDPSLRVLTAMKNNCGERPPALGYRIDSDDRGRAVVEWTGPLALTAEDVSRPPVRLRSRDRACVWLRSLLASGPRKCADVEIAAAAAGIPDKAIKEAKREIGVRSHQVYSKTEHAWYWYDPTAPWPKDPPFKKPYELPPLPDLADVLGR